MKKKKFKNQNDIVCCIMEIFFDENEQYLYSELVINLISIETLVFQELVTNIFISEIMKVISYEFL